MAEPRLRRDVERAGVGLLTLAPSAATATLSRTAAAGVLGRRGDLGPIWGAARIVACITAPAMARRVLGHVERGIDARGAMCGRDHAGVR